MVEMMKAAVLEDRHKLVVKDVPVPSIGPDEILIRVVACGICHTDEGYIEGVPTYKKLPLILGHEASGHVHELGERVTQFKVGDPVLIPPVLTCGNCKYCLVGKETLCKRQEMLGNHIDGAFAEYIAVKAKDIVKVPEGLDLVELSIVSDAVATPYHAVYNRARVRPGDVVVVIGCGGVGINVVQFASVAGAKVIALDLQQSKLDLAKELGADIVINPSVDDPKALLKSMGGADIVFEVIGNPSTQQLGFDLLGAGGKLVLVGYSPKKWDGFRSGKVMFRELEVIGSLGCPPREFARILHMVKRGMIKVSPLISHRFPLDKIDDAFEVLRSGEGIRTVVTM